MSIHSQLPYDQSTSHARIPAGGINLIASIDSVSEAQFTASFFGSTKALHGEVATTSPATTTHNHSNQQYSITAVTTSSGTALNATPTAPTANRRSAMHRDLKSQIHRFQIGIATREENGIRPLVCITSVHDG